ncbi:gamma-glutamylcyclotransferase [Lampropedia puyangensis]|uniref:Gamma-glutamylcyclotransferase n=1 Tax=Lampropedia puyangensis TaxID=1330072 RepID=A0A4S8F3K2_9BURK|nr:gamma-glutamylcyclotransferase family protein [Lampropedia puyangensis]THU00694.1 gamma-glutamylcyclotransferase [Lampropedia puyangensis]
MTTLYPHALFTYGTLQREEVQQHLFGRTLSGQAAQLQGFTLGYIEQHDDASRLTGLSRFLMLEPNPASTQTIAGMVYQLTQSDLQQADLYEGPQYQRIEVPLTSGQRAWVYVTAHTSPA